MFRIRIIRICGLYANLDTYLVFGFLINLKLCVIIAYMTKHIFYNMFNVIFVSL